MARGPKDKRDEKAKGGHCSVCTNCARRLTAPFVDITVAEAPDDHTVFRSAADLCSYKCLAEWATGRPEEWAGQVIRKRHEQAVL